MNAKVKSAFLFGLKITLLLLAVNLVLYRPLTTKTMIEIAFSSLVAGILGGLIINPLTALFSKTKKADQS